MTVMYDALYQLQDTCISESAYGSLKQVTVWKKSERKTKAKQGKECYPPANYTTDCGAKNNTVSHTLKDNQERHQMM